MAYFLTSYPTIADAVAAIGTDPAELIIDRPETVSQDLTIPHNVRIRATESLTLASGVSITVKGEIDVGHQTLFLYEDETCNINFAQPTDAYSHEPFRSVLRPEWWGAVGNGSDAAASANRVGFNRMFRVNPGESKFNFPITYDLRYAQQYRVDGPLRILAQSFSLLGNNSGIQTTATSATLRSMPLLQLGEGYHFDGYTRASDSAKLFSLSDVFVAEDKGRTIVFTLPTDENPVSFDIDTVHNSREVTVALTGGGNPSFGYQDSISWSFTPLTKSFYGLIDRLILNTGTYGMGVGVRVENADFLHMRDCRVGGFYRAISGGYVSQEPIFEEVQITGAWYGYYFDAISEGAAGPPNVARITGGKIQQCAHYAMYFRGASHVKIDGVDLSINGGGEAFAYITCADPSEYTDGESFTIRHNPPGQFTPDEVTFEFDTDSHTTGVPIDISSASTAEDVAQAVATAIDVSNLDLEVNAVGAVVKISDANSGAGVAQIYDAPIYLETTPDSSGVPAGYFTCVPAADITDTESITFNDRYHFEFDKDLINNSANRRWFAVDISSAPTAADVAAALAIAINKAGIPITAQASGDDVRVFWMGEPGVRGSLKITKAVADTDFTWTPLTQLQSSSDGGNIFLEGVGAFDIHAYSELAGGVWTRDGALYMYTSNCPPCNRHLNDIVGMYLVNSANGSIHNGLYLQGGLGTNPIFASGRWSMIIKDSRNIRLSGNHHYGSRDGDIWLQGNCQNIYEDGTEVGSLNYGEEVGYIRVRDDSTGKGFRSITSGDRPVPRTFSRTTRVQNFVLSPWDLSSIASAADEFDGPWYSASVPATLDGTTLGPDGATSVPVLVMDGDNPQSNVQHLTALVPSCRGKTVKLQFWGKYIELLGAGGTGRNFPRLRVLMYREGELVGGRISDDLIALGPDWIKLPPCTLRVPNDGVLDSRIQIAISNRTPETFKCALAAFAMWVEGEGEYYDRGPTAALKGLNSLGAASVLRGPVLVGGGDYRSRVWSGDRPPTIGTYQTGDVVLNGGDGDKTTLGWSCAEGGSPGIWTPLVTSVVKRVPLNFAAPAGTPPAGVSTVVAVDGALPGDQVSVSIDRPMPSSEIFLLDGHVSDINEVTVRWVQLTGGSGVKPDGGGGVYTIEVRKNEDQLVAPAFLRLGGDQLPLAPTMALLGKDCTPGLWTAQYGSNFKIYSTGTMPEFKQDTSATFRSPLHRGVKFNQGKVYQCLSTTQGNISAAADGAFFIVYNQSDPGGGQRRLYSKDDGTMGISVLCSGNRLQIYVRDGEGFANVVFDTGTSVPTGDIYRTLFYAWDHDENSTDGCSGWVDGAEIGSGSSIWASSSIGALIPSTAALVGGDAVGNNYDNEVVAIYQWIGDDLWPGAGNRTLWGALAAELDARVRR